MKALLVVDHGSKRQEANEALQEVVEMLKPKIPDWIVQWAHMDIASPDINTGIQNCIDAGATEIWVHPFMLTPGRHAQEDVPQIVGEMPKKIPSYSYEGIGWTLRPSTACPDYIR